MKKNKITKFKTLAQERESIEYLTRKKEIIESSIQVNQSLKNNNIRSLDDIGKLIGANYEGDKIYSLLPKAPTKIVEIKHPFINNSEPFTTEVIFTIDSTELEQLAENIKRPTKEQISKINADLYFSTVDYYFTNRRSNEIINYSKKQDDTISAEEILEVYYRQELQLIKLNLEKEYIKNLSNQEVEEHYEKDLSRLNKESEQIKNLILLIQESLKHNETSTYKGQPTYKDFFYATNGKQKGKISELNRKQEEIKLLEDLIYSDPSLSNEEKIKVLQNVKIENVEFEIDRWLGKKLNRHERRILRALRSIIYQLIEQGKITGCGKSLYEAEIPLAEIYNEYGLTPRPTGGYQHNQTKLIQDILFGFSSSGLHKDILFNHHGIQKTRFILQLQEIKQKVKIKTKEVEQRISIRIAVPSFLFVSNLKLQNYYHQDTVGLKRFMEIKGVAQSNHAFNMVEYFELHFSTPKKEIEFNLDTLIKESELENRYKKNKKEAIDTLETIFNKMTEANYLIKSWKIVRGKYGQEKYVFENSRYELFTKNKKIAQIKNLSTTAKK